MGQQSHSATNTKLNRIAWLLKQDSGKKFECLMHLFNQESLIDCFCELDESKAVGIDDRTLCSVVRNCVCCSLEFFGHHRNLKAGT